MLRHLLAILVLLTLTPLAFSNEYSNVAINGQVLTVYELGALELQLGARVAPVTTSSTCRTVAGKTSPPVRGAVRIPPWTPIPAMAAAATTHKGTGITIRKPQAGL